MSLVADESEYVQVGETIDWTADATYSQGDIIQLRDGRAGQITADCASGDLVGVRVAGIIRVEKTTSMVVLVTSKLFWDHSADKAHLLHVNDRDFYLGVAMEDAAAAATDVLVNLNVQPVYTIGLEHGFASVRVQTAGFVTGAGAGREGCNLEFSATNEAQKTDALTHRSYPSATGEGIAHFLITVVDNGDNAALDMDWGLAVGTHATDVEAITKRVVFHLDGNTLDLDLASDDGSTDTTLVDTTINIVEGTPFLCQLDVRNPAVILAYVNGVRVLDGVTGTATTLNIGTDNFKVLVHMEKTADDSPANLSCNYAGVAIAQV